MSIAIIILSDVSDPSLLSQLNMFNMWILAKYVVILRVVGMKCTRDGAVVERVKTTMLRHLKNPLLAPVKITLLR